MTDVDAAVPTAEAFEALGKIIGGGGRLNAAAVLQSALRPRPRPDLKAAARRAGEMSGVAPVRSVTEMLAEM